jgi:hypothetical protein
MNSPCEDELTQNLKEISWQDYLEQSKKMIPYWIFRGQSYEEPTMRCLMSRFEERMKGTSVKFQHLTEKSSTPVI